MKILVVGSEGVPVQDLFTGMGLKAEVRLISPSVVSQRDLIWK